MRGRKSLFIASFALLCTAFAACASTAEKFVIALPNGYYVERDKASQAQIVKRTGGVVVRGPIAAYGVDRYIVTGLVGNVPNSGSSYPNDSPIRVPPELEKSVTYFILDTASGKLDTGLNTAAWEARMKELGVKVAGGIRAPLLPK
jgi:hypothetical protein